MCCWTDFSLCMEGFFTKILPSKRIGLSEGINTFIKAFSTLIFMKSSYISTDIMTSTFGWAWSVKLNAIPRAGGDTLDLWAIPSLFFGWCSVWSLGDPQFILWLMFSLIVGWSPVYSPLSSAVQKSHSALLIEKLKRVHEWMGRSMVRHYRLLPNTHHPPLTYHHSCHHHKSWVSSRETGLSQTTPPPLLSTCSHSWLYTYSPVSSRDSVLV